MDAEHLVIKLNGIVAGLQMWIEETIFYVEGRPLAEFSYSDAGFEILIDRAVLFNSSKDDFQNLTLEYCKQVYLNRIEELAPFIVGEGINPSAVKELLEACEQAVGLMEKNIYPQPDKPDSPWGILQNLKAAIKKARS